MPGEENPSLKRTSSPLHRVKDGLNRVPLAAFKRFILVDINLPNILLNAGILSYLMFTVRTLWKVSTMFHSQPHTAAVGFIVPSVATYAFVQRYSPSKSDAQIVASIPQAAVDVTILAGAFICTYIVWSLLSYIGDLGAMIFLVISFGTQYIPATW
ncbi:hypothetical protein EV360DRAFT_65674 [Lentinula raphanica]|nr:hypothetical protein EV360DRAFT_65674 [Lentinula raphanica]